MLSALDNSFRSNRPILYALGAARAISAARFIFFIWMALFLSSFLYQSSDWHIALTIINFAVALVATWAWRLLALDRHLEYRYVFFAVYLYEFRYIVTVPTAAAAIGFINSIYFGASSDNWLYYLFIDVAVLCIMLYGSIELHLSLNYGVSSSGSLVTEPSPLPSLTAIGLLIVIGAVTAICVLISADFGPYLKDHIWGWVYSSAQSGQVLKLKYTLVLLYSFQVFLVWSYLWAIDRYRKKIKEVAETDDLRFKQATIVGRTPIIVGVLAFWAIMIFDVQAYSSFVGLICIWYTISVVLVEVITVIGQRAMFGPEEK